jgi:hypothetical protein
MEVLNIYGPPLNNVTSSKNFYQQYQSTKLYVESIEKQLDALQKELDTLVIKSGPANVRAIVYDSMPGVAIKVPDMQVLERISALRIAIDINKTNLKSWSETLDDLKRSIIKKSKQLDDLPLKVFVAGWIEGKTNPEIAHELGYSVGRIWNVKVEINQLLRVS